MAWLVTQRTKPFWTKLEAPRYLPRGLVSLPVVERIGFEPMTFRLQSGCSPS